MSIPPSMHAKSDARAKKVIGTDFPPGHHPRRYVFFKFLPMGDVSMCSSAKLNKIKDKNGKDQKYITIPMAI